MMRTTRPRLRPTMRTAAALATATLATLASACLSVPAYEPAQAVAYSDDGLGGTASGPGFALHFADGDGFHFPDALTIDGVNVLGRDSAAGCADADEAGFLISPTPRIAAHGGAHLLMNRLSPVLRGPAATKIKLEWATWFDCKPERTPGGTSTFTVFPDGRIVRHDVLADTSSAEISAFDCACSTGDQGFTVTAFWTIARAAFSSLSAFASNSRPLPSAGETISNESVACLDAGSHQLSFAWRTPPFGTAVRGGDSSVEFARDMVIGASRLDAYTWENNSALFVGRAGCTKELLRAVDYVQPRELRINGVSFKPASRDGIYGGEDATFGGSGRDEPRGIALGEDRVELTGAVDGSFAVWLRFPHPVAELRATLEGATGAWYLPQQVNDREWIVWFRDSLAAAQKIVIEPR